MTATGTSAPPRYAPLNTLWSLMRGHRLLFGTAITALLVANCLGYLAPLIGSATLDLALAASAGPQVSALSQHLVALLGGAEYLRMHLWLGAGLMALCTAASGVFSFLKGWLAALASDRIARRLKIRLYDHLQHLPARYHDTANSGDLVQRCTSDVETVRMCLSAQVVEIGNAAILILTALPVMLMLNGLMTALSFVLVVPIVLWGFIYFRRVKHVFRKVDEAEGRVTSRVQENLTGIRVVRAFARAEFEKERFAGPNAEYRDRSLHMLRLMAWYWSSSDLVCLLQNGIVLIGGSWLAAHGRLSVGDLFAFMAILNLMLWPVRMIGRVLTDLGKTSVALGRLQEILEVEEEAHDSHASAAGATDGRSEKAAQRAALQDLPDAGNFLSARERSGARRSAPLSSPDPAPFTGRIDFHNVVFSHAQAPDGRPQVAGEASKGRPATPARDSPPRHALDGVSFSIKPGETIAILGPSGSGKSTLIHLLLRFYDPQQGKILLDGRELRTLDRRWTRSQFGVVMQEPFLYSKTLRENIRLGRSAAAEAEVADAARVASIHDTIVGFDAGYDTEIGERGITLSGGQRQRVAIARAVVRDPPVLVLDDALSAVDSETEIAIIDALRQRRGRRTTILIAHRLSTLAHADRIVVLEHGQVTQLGTHRELVAAGGLYQRLWRIQTQLDEDVSTVGTVATSK